MLLLTGAVCVCVRVWRGVCVCGWVGGWVMKEDGKEQEDWKEGRRRECMEGEQKG